MKELLRKEWMAYTRVNLVYIAIFILAFLILKGWLWINYTDIIPILYMVAASVVVSWFRDYMNGWHAFESFTYSAKSRIAAKYTMVLGYGLLCAVIVFLICRNFACALAALLCTCIIPALCAPFTMLRSSSPKHLIVPLLAGILITLFPAILISAYAAAIQMKDIIKDLPQPQLMPAYTILMPAVILAVSAIASYFISKED